MLERGGYEVVVLPVLDHLPDAVFVEDVAVIVDDTAVITRPGAEPRAAEPPHIVAALQDLVSVDAMTVGRLDGGDVLVAGDVVFIGLSERTDREGAAQFSSKVQKPVTIVNVERGLHLKSAASAIGDVVVTTLPEDTFPGVEVIRLTDVPDYAANVVPLPDGTVLVTHAGAAEQLSERGYSTSVVDVSEFQRADGALTCLSLRTE